MKKITILALLLISWSIYSVDITGSESPTKQTTGSFNEPMDQYLDTIDYNLLDSSVLFFQFDMPTAGSNNEPLQFGIGHAVNDMIYVGASALLINPGQDSTKSEELMSDSEVMFDVNDNYQGYKDVIEKKSITSTNSQVGGDILVGLNLSSLSLGIKLSVYTHDFGSKGYYDTNFDEVNNQTTEIYSADGTKIYESKTNYDEEAYNNNNLLWFGGNIGTKLNVSKFALDLEIGGGLKTEDISSKTNVITSITDFNTIFPDYNGTVGATSNNDETVEDVNIKTDLNLNVSVSTEFKLSEKFALEAGLKYAPIFTTYSDGGTTNKRDTTDYVITLDSDPSFYTTTKQTYNYKSINEQSETLHDIMIPLALRSTYSDKMQFSVANTTTVSLYEETSKVSDSSKFTTDITSTDTLVDHTITTWTGNSSQESTETTSTTVENETSVGVKFFLTEKLRINLGSELTFTPYKIENISETNDVTSEETSTIQVNDDEAVTTYHTIETNPVASLAPKNSEIISDVDNAITYKAGLTYFLNEYMTLDLFIKDFSADGDIWSTSTWGLMATIKY